MGFILEVLVYLLFSGDLFSFSSHSTSALIQTLSSRMGVEMD
jgi:hypothetical protein